MAGNERAQMGAITVFDQVMNSATPCATAWGEVNLSALRRSLDEQALAIAEHQESSLESRKAIAARAKSFRAAVEGELEATSELRAASQALVRAFKGEIDSLTTRSRFGEGAFINLYKLIREAPDPVVTVEALTDAARTAVKALEERNRYLEQQGLETERQLEALRASAAASGGTLTAEELQEERRVLREEVASEQAEKEQLRLQALQDAVQEELLHAQRQAEQERAAGQAQLQLLQGEVEQLETRAALVEEEATRTVQLEEEARARDELVRSLKQQVDALKTERQSLAEREAAAVQAEKRATADFVDARSTAKNVERALENRVRDLEEEAGRFQREAAMGADASEVEAMREKIRILEGIWGGEEQEAGQELCRSETVRNSAEHNHGSDTLDDTAPDGERQGERANPAVSSNAGSGAAGSGPTSAEPQITTTAVNRSGEQLGDGDSAPDLETNIEESETDLENDPQRPGPGKDWQRTWPTSGSSVVQVVGSKGKMEGGTASGGSGKMNEDENSAGVDAWLISYNRRLKTELERLRGRTRQAEERLRVVEETRAAEHTELVERQQDVKRLEQDLLDAHQVVEAGKTMLRAFQSGPVAKQFGKLMDRRKNLEGNSSNAHADDFRDDDLLDPTEEQEAGANPEGFSPADRLLAAVKRQRERFRKEALRREREASIAKGNAEQLTRDNQELRRENMHLYKKIRFVMSYGGTGLGSDGGAASLAPAAAEQLTETKYARLYEEDLDPFKEFDSQEKAARLNRMSVLDKWLYWGSGTILRNRFRRHALLLYLLVVHAVLLLLVPVYGKGESLYP